MAIFQGLPQLVSDLPINAQVNLRTIPPLFALHRQICPDMATVDMAAQWTED